MNPQLLQNQLPASPFLNNAGAFDIPGLCEALDIPRVTLTQTLGESRQTISKYFREPRKFIKPQKDASRDFLLKLNQVYVLLLALMDKDTKPEQVRAWFHSPNKALKMARPLDLVQQKKLDKLIVMLMDILNAAQGG